MITVRAYSVDWLLHLTHQGNSHDLQLEEVVYQCHASNIKKALVAAGGQFLIASMTTGLISSKAPLFYYSFQQVRTKDNDISEVHAANKVTIRKNDDFVSNGLEFLVYNCALSPIPELCDGIRYTKIDRDNLRRVEFYGKGVSGNGIPLNNRMGVFQYQDDMPEVAFARTDMKNIYSYHNFYKPYNTNHDVFAISPSAVQEFIASTGSMLQGQPYDPLRNIWHAIRAFVLNYYSVKFGMSAFDFRGVSSEEWDKKDKATGLLDNISLLKQLEALCDEKVFDAYKDYRNGKEVLFKRKLEGMVSIIGTYYILYRTLI